MRIADLGLSRSFRRSEDLTRTGTRSTTEGRDPVSIRDRTRKGHQRPASQSAVSWLPASVLSAPIWRLRHPVDLKPQPCRLWTLMARHIARGSYSGQLRHRCGGHIHRAAVVRRRRHRFCRVERFQLNPLFCNHHVKGGLFLLFAMYLNFKSFP
jgi:hypothetical protein